MNLILDTETSGLFTRSKNKKENKEDAPFYTKLECFESCRIVSICWLVVQYDDIINQSYYIIKPDNFIISEESFNIHGISQEEADTTGIVLKDIFDLFKEALESCKYVTAHNIDFDFNVIMAELYRYGRNDIIDIFNSKKLICTMKKGKDVMGMPRYPKLGVLYKYLYDKEITNAHNALSDTLHCFYCYIKMFPRDRNIFFYHDKAIELTPEQKQIIYAPINNHISVIAAAGSGKTTSICCRIKYLLEQGISEDSIILTTFSRDAAYEFKKRLVDILGYIPEILIGTIDSIARKYASSDVNKIDVSEYSHEFLINIIHNPSLISQYKYLFVDEYQDINQIQYEIINVFHENGIYICGIGDPNQNIYSFRGSNSAYLKNFFSGSLEFKLSRNFRSTCAITEFCDAISPNGMTSELKDEKENTKVQVRYFQTKDLLHTYIIKDAPTAILCPNNIYLYEIEEILISNHIPYHILEAKSANTGIGAVAGTNTNFMKEGICLSTIHKSKGLEWSDVMLIQINDKFLPKNKNSESINAGRNLFYVGCTRAQKRLRLCYTGPPEITRYMSTIPADLYEFIDSKPENMCVNIDNIDNIDNGGTKTLDQQVKDANIYELRQNGYLTDRTDSIQVLSPLEVPAGIDIYEWESYIKIRLGQLLEGSKYRDHYAEIVFEMRNIPIEFKQDLYSSAWKMAICKRVVLDGRKALIYSAKPELPSLNLNIQNIKIKKILETHNMFLAEYKNQDILFECRTSVRAANVLRVLFCRDNLKLQNTKVAILNIIDGTLVVF